MPTVSIIIPAFNSARWIRDTLRSALAQTWPDKEIILVDDDSSDQTLAIAKQYESSILKIIRQEHSGPGTGRNRALRAAQGDYIQYLDHDDLLSPDKVEAQIRLLMESPARKVAVSPAVYFMDGQEPDAGIRQDGWPIIDSDDPLNWLIDLFGPDGPFSMVPPGCWLTPRTLVEEAGAWDELPTPDDDGDFFTRVLVRSSGLRRCDRGAFYFRKHRTGQNLSATKSEELHWGALRSTEMKAKALLERTDSSRAMRALANLFVERAFVSYPYYPKITALALDRAEELGGASFFPPFGSWRGQLLRRLIGWKATKRANVLFHRYKNRLSGN